MKLSLVIPVYNEERHIAACLQAIAKQTSMPDEVIVVDNNCTDDTIKIVESFDFVRVVHEKKQGRSRARDAGFRAAKYEIIGRIDADSYIDERWVERVKNHFAKDSEVYGLTGMGRSALIPYLHRPKTTLYCRVYYWNVHARFHTITMWGATMAIRRTAFQAIQSEVSHDDENLHEDQDISLCMAARGLKIIQTNDVRVDIDGQSYRYLPKFIAYVRMFYGSLRRHKDRGTFARSEFRRLPFLYTLPGVLLSVLPSAIMFALTVLLYPVDVFAIRFLGYSPR